MTDGTPAVLSKLAAVLDMDTQTILAQRLLASSASNWSQELIAAREDRL